MKMRFALVLLPLVLSGCASAATSEVLELTGLDGDRVELEVLPAR